MAATRRKTTGSRGQASRRAGAVKATLKKRLSSAKPSKLAKKPMLKKAAPKKVVKKASPSRSQLKATPLISKLSQQLQSTWVQLGQEHAKNFVMHEKLAKQVQATVATAEKQLAANTQKLTQWSAKTATAQVRKQIVVLKKLIANQEKVLVEGKKHLLNLHALVASARQALDHHQAMDAAMMQFESDWKTGKKNSSTMTAVTTTTTQASSKKASAVTTKAATSTTLEAMAKTAYTSRVTTPPISSAKSSLSSSNAPSIPSLTNEGKENNIDKIIRTRLLRSSTWESETEGSTPMKPETTA